MISPSWSETSHLPTCPIPSSPTDTDPVTLPLVPEIPSSPDSSDLEETENEHDRNKTSVYLDATEDNPSVADILRELREIPEDIVHTYARPVPLALSDEAQQEDTPPRSPLPILLQPQSRHPLTPTITTTTPSRQRSGIRHSFSSSVGPNRPDGQAEAVVELHEESASAFQDFLFWAYPQYVDHPTFVAIR